MAKCRGHFTLVELLVAIGLLSLIMMLLLQLFGGAQKLWRSSEKTDNVYADARVAMELMTELINTVQFSHGEAVDSNGPVYYTAGDLKGKPARDPDKDMLFHLDAKSTIGGGDDSENGRIIFVSRSSRDLPKKDSDIRFIEFRRGTGDNKGRLYMVVYSDKEDADFNKYFPQYSNFGGGRGKLTDSKAIKSLVSKLDGILSDAVDNSSGENEYCQIIADNVVAFKLTASRLDADGKLKKITESYDVGEHSGYKKDCSLDDLREPPYMLEIQLTMLDPDSYREYRNLSGTAQTNYLKQNQRTFTRSIHIGDRWALEAK